MAARPTWKGYLKISLVNIPIKVFPATDAGATLSFNQLHAECQTRIQQKRWCPHCEREVPNTDIVKGFEFEKGRYVIVNEEDIEKVRVESTRVISLEKFTEDTAIDPIYLERPVLSGAGRTGRARGVRGHPRRHGRQGRHRQGRALRPRVSREGPAARAGAGDVHAPARQRNPQHECDRGALRHAGEGEAGGSEARQAGHRAPSRATSICESYQDDYQVGLREIIDAKIDGREVVAQEIEAPPKVVNLMEALRKSLDTISAKKKPATVSDVPVAEKKRKRA